MSDSQLPAVRPQVTAGGQVGALIPQSIDEAWRLSEAFAKAKILPRGITEAPQVMLIICGGAEVGFGPFQSLQSFYLVNNRLTLWGDAIPALLWSNGFKLREWYENSDPAYPDNMVAKCLVTRPDGTEIEGEFSVGDAKEANLWGKDGPWQTSRKRMLKMRARAFTARDGAPDVLRGVAIREEVEDYDVIDVMATPAAPLHAGFEDKPRRGKRQPPALTETRQQPEPQAEGPATEEPQQIEPGHAAPGEVYLHTEDTVPTEEGRWLTFKDGERFSSVADLRALKVYAQHSPEAPDPSMVDQNACEHEWASDGAVHTCAKCGLIDDAGEASPPRPTETGGAQPAEPEPDTSGPVTDASNDGGHPEEGSGQSAPADDDSGEEEDEGEELPPAFAAYADAIEKVGSWDDAKKTMQDFYTSDFFKGLTEEAKNGVRCQTWETLKEIGVKTPDPITDISAFRLFIESVTDIEAITGSFAYLQKDPTAAFGQKPQGTQDAIRAAVDARIATLKGK